MGSMLLCRSVAWGQTPTTKAAQPAKAAPTAKNDAKAEGRPLAWTFNVGDVLAYDVRWSSVEGDAGATAARMAGALAGRIELTVMEGGADRGVVGVKLMEAQGSWSDAPSGWTPKAIGAIDAKDAMLGATRALDNDGVSATLNLRGETMSVDGFAAKVGTLKLVGSDLDQSHATTHTLGANDDDLRVLLCAMLHVLPEKPAAVGGTWTTTLDRSVPGVGTLREEITFTLKSMGADNIGVLAIAGKAMLSDAVSTDLGKAELRESRLEGEARFDAKAGRLTLINRSATYKVAMPPAIGTAPGAAAEVVEIRQSLSAAINSGASKSAGTSAVDAGAKTAEPAIAAGGDDAANNAAAEGPDFIKEPGELAWGWTEGETMRYRITYANSTKVVGLGESGTDNSQKVTIDVTMLVTKVGEDKSASATLTFDRARMAMTMPMMGETVYDTADPENVPPMMTSFARPIQVMMKKPLDLELSRNGAIKALKGFAKLADQFIAAMPMEEFGGEEAAEAMRAQMKSQMTDEMLRNALEPFLRILPDKPVKKGETWVVPGRKSSGFGAQDEPPVTYVFDDVQEVDGVRCAYVSTKQAGRTQNMGAEEGEGPQFKMRQNDTTGRYVFIIELGKVLNAETRTSMSYGGDLPGQDEEGFQREYKSTTTQTMSIEMIE